MGIIVLGMHRSGTSAVTRLLNLMGANLGPAEGLAEPAEDNPAGFWERLDVRRANDRLLAAQGRSWVDCLDVGFDNLVRSETQHIAWSARKLIGELDSNSPWALKDPRFSLTLDAWRPYLENPVCVLVHRDPQASALSLRKRNEIPMPLGRALWEHYNLSALRAVADLPRIGLAYEDLLADPLATADRLLDHLAAAGIQELKRPGRDELLAFVDPSLDHHRGLAVEVEDEPATEFQQVLLSRLRDGSAFENEVSPLSSESREILEQASAAWPGQTWITRLLEERNQEVARLEIALEKAETRADPTRTRPSGVARALDEDRVPGVFILGAPRSGTSIFSWAIAAHPKFQTSAESDFLLTLFGGGRMHGSYKSAYNRPDVGWLKKMEVGYREFAAFAGLGIEHLYLDRYSGRRWVDATPSYTGMGEDLLLLFPAAHFLHILRDGRAVVNSMCSSGFPASWANDFGKACETWAHYASRGRALADAHPERVMEIRYESLTSDPSAQLEKIYSFLGVEPCEESVQLISTQRINSSYGNVESGDIRKAKDPATAPRRPWEAWDSTQQEIFRETAGPVMKALGYTLEFEKP